MDEEKRPPIKLNVGIGIIGTASYTTSVGENSKTIKIERHGSARGNVIPSVIVVCEDDLAKEVLGMVTNETKGSYKIITAGAWDNMPTLLYGIYFYREQLGATGDKRYLEVVCVTDGDINKRHLEAGLKNVHSGNNVPGDMVKALDLAKENLYGFHLGNKLPSIGGLPEYHHQLWLNEVTPEVVDAHHQDRVSMLEAALERAEEKHAPSINVELLNLKRDMTEVKRITDASRNILFHTLKNDDDKIDCHKFYDVLRGKLSGGNHFDRYPLHQLEYSVLSIIRKYNPDRWQAYIAPVKDAMEHAFERHLKMFTPDRFNLTEIGSTE
ncbi:hypothetical protein D3C76_435970 [compost metagenome]|uniref:hypothetical protein n=1 Tax=Pseudomonas sp. PSKL.D1 TaxID=3029060 RepID=UPI000F949706|nr:hypothetical protein [Pseudomonas sp. PSKL.D1]WDY56567.1 hypothetical protein PVV54_18500 [Pseudomonas sp. PSKL.D1]